MGIVRLPATTAIVAPLIFVLELKLVVAPIALTLLLRVVPGRMGVVLPGVHGKPTPIVLIAVATVLLKKTKPVTVPTVRSLAAMEMHARPTYLLAVPRLAAPFVLFRPSFSVQTTMAVVLQDAFLQTTAIVLLFAVMASLTRVRPVMGIARRLVRMRINVFLPNLWVQPKLAVLLACLTQSLSAFSTTDVVLTDAMQIQTQIVRPNAEIKLLRLVKPVMAIVH